MQNLLSWEINVGRYIERGASRRLIKKAQTLLIMAARINAVVYYEKFFNQSHCNMLESKNYSKACQEWYMEI